MSELHHPHCPRYFLDGREIECSASPACKCVACEDCEGEGEVDILYHERFDLGGPRFESCRTCHGIGRVLR